MRFLSSSGPSLAILKVYDALLKVCKHHTQYVPVETRCEAVPIDVQLATPGNQDPTGTDWLPTNPVQRRYIIKFINLVCNKKISSTYTERPPLSFA